MLKDYWTQLQHSDGMTKRVECHTLETAQRMMDGTREALTTKLEGEQPLKVNKILSSVW